MDEMDVLYLTIEEIAPSIGRYLMAQGSKVPKDGHASKLASEVGIAIDVDMFEEEGITGGGFTDQDRERS